MTKIARLLFPADLSEVCRQAIPSFAKLAKLLGAELTVLHVVDPSGFYYDVMDMSYRRMCDIEAEKVAAAQRQFDAFVSHLSACIPIRSVLRTGRIADTIVSYAREEGFDTIIIPTTHHNRLFAAMKKSLTAKLMDDSNAAIWTVDSALAHCEAHCGSVVCALALHEDRTLNEPNNNIIETAKYVAGKLGSELVFVHVLEKGEMPVTGEDATAQILRQLEGICKSAGAKVKCRVENGNVARAISDVAWQENAAVLVTGRNRKQALFGATQSRVLDIVHLSPCPLISVVRTPR
ncbi:MAG TPA: universal stress protein [Bryobacteraceae bacterium]|nr:universal stress protein [Bryobacteraceae bacterium]